MAPELPAEYVSFWLNQSKLFLGLVVALIASNVLVAGSVGILAWVLWKKN
jgi:hypothetical protein